MKKVTLLLSCFILLSAFTCENESLDNDVDPFASNASSSNLIGDWTLTGLNGTITSVTDLDGDVFEGLIEFEGSNFDYLMTFDGSNYIGQGSYDATITATVDGQFAGTETTAYESAVSEGTYSIYGNTMIVNGTFIEVDGVEGQSAGPQELNFTLSPDGQTLTLTQNMQFVQQVAPNASTNYDIEVITTLQLQ